MARTDIPVESLPPLKTPITLDYRPARPGAELTRCSTRIIAREAPSDWLDALRAPSGPVAVPKLGDLAWLLWGDGDMLYRYRVRVEEIAQPIPAVRVRYLGPPDVIERRQERRSPVNITGRFHIQDSNGEGLELLGTAAVPRPWQTMTRDVGYSSIRFYTPESMGAGVHLATEWDLDSDHMLAWPMVVVRTLPGESVYRAIPGYDVVALWESPLPPAEQTVWRRFCDEQRYG